MAAPGARVWGPRLSGQRPRRRAEAMQYRDISVVASVRVAVRWPWREAGKTASQAAGSGAPRLGWRCRAGWWLRVALRDWLVARVELQGLVFFKKEKGEKKVLHLGR